MNYQYKVYFTINAALGEHQRKDRDMVITAINPIRALDIFHKNVQSLAEKTMGGMVTRPKLNAEDYKITKFVQCYRDEVKGMPMIESVIDMPNTSNPEIGVNPKEAKVIQSEMPLEDERKSPESNHEEAPKQALD